MRPQSEHLYPRPPSVFGIDIGSLLSKFTPQDALSEAGLLALEAQIAPVFATARSLLLQRVTGDPPATFADHLRNAGWPIDDAAARVLWSATIAALAEEPCKASQAS